MSLADIHFWASIPASLLLVLAGCLTLTGSFCLLRFQRFYARVLSATLGNTMGAACVLLASILVFSSLLQRPLFHKIVITLLLVLSSPVTATFLMRATVYRNRGKPYPPQTEQTYGRKRVFGYAAARCVCVAGR